ncbi:GntP family permease [Bacillus sp. DX4.1]|uniref:GntP family permease n=1 Tax=Bacillus sp. DX4.1 TaxID=3055867 RepID=UPI0025A15A0D|nr:GntP family permease [Bacillus sp. DX4.1]MDM5189240.1 GntP family permease [Bacillus sp. DX4.1]
MDIVVILIALSLLMFFAYRGFSVILFAPLCALLAVFLTEPSHVLPFFSNIFMEKLVGFVKLYFPVFLLGAIFGKLVEVTGVAEKIAKIIVRFIGAKQAILAIVLMGAILTYSGVSLFVAVFAIYPFAAQLFREANIPKRLIPATIAFSAFTFSMDSLPGSPQIQNVIPTTFFKTNIYAAPTLGIIGALFIFILGMLYLERCRRKALANGEGYYGMGDKAIKAESEMAANSEAAMSVPTPGIIEERIVGKDWFAFLPLLIVGIMNKFFTEAIPTWYASGFDFAVIGLKAYGKIDMAQVIGIWSVELALIMGIITTILLNIKKVRLNFNTSMNVGISGSLLATMNTAAEYGFGGVIAALPGFAAVQHSLTGMFTNPLVSGAVMTNILCGITGSGSGGMSITLSLMADKYIEAASTFQIPLEVLHRVIAMSAGGLDTLPHNGAVITLLAVTGLTHRQAYKDIFAITIIKTMAVFFVIGMYVTFSIV